MQAVSRPKSPNALWQAAVAIEDERFFTHNGVDWKRTLKAVVNLFTDKEDTFGGSTITQQVLKNTAIVACCVVAVGVFIWLFDFVAQVGIDALIGLFH